MNLWIWIFQRISAVLLTIFLVVHFGVMHFVDPKVELTFTTSSLRLQGLLYFVVDAGLLTLGLFHGLNGLRNIILDYWPRAARPAGWILGLFGLGATVYGSIALFQFITTV